MTEGFDYIRIGELAKILGTSTKTLRFYEARGLLVQPARSAAGYRLYGPDSVRRARKVVELRRMGLSIQELQKLLKPDDGSTRRQRLLASLDEKLRQQDLELGILQGRRDDLAARYEALLTTPSDRPADCVCDALLIPCHCNGDTPADT